MSKEPKFNLRKIEEFKDGNHIVMKLADMGKFRRLIIDLAYWLCPDMCWARLVEWCFSGRSLWELWALRHTKDPECDYCGQCRREDDGQSTTKS